MEDMNGLNPHHMKFLQLILCGIFLNNILNINTNLVALLFADYDIAISR